MAGKVVKWILNLAPVRAVIDLSKQIILPGFDGLPLHDVMAFFLKGIQKGAVITRASAVSFKLFLALLPFSIMLLSLIPYIPIDNFQGELLNSFKELVPGPLYDLLSGALEDLVHKKHNTVLSIGFVLTLYYASNSINAILTSFNSSYHLTVQRNPVRQRIISLGLIVALSALIIAGISLMIFSNTFFEYLDSHKYVQGDFAFAMLYVAKWTLIVLLFLSSVSMLYNIGDTQRKSWRIVSAGSTLATVATLVVSWGFSYYVTHFGSYDKLYGSLGTLIVLLLWINMNSIILLIGFELNASISNAKRQKIEL
jgi:membrane protein